MPAVSTAYWKPSELSEPLMVIPESLFMKVMERLDEVTEDNAPYRIPRIFNYLLESTRRVAHADIAGFLVEHERFVKAIEIEITPRQYTLKLL